MKLKYILISLSCLLISNCAKNPESHVNHLEGYWEIDQVTLTDGTEKKYNYNNTIDYIEILDSTSGYRVKLKPLFDGSFETSKDSEKFTIKIENDSLNLYYKTPFDSWKETVLFATDNQLQIINRNKLVFLYKKYLPLNLE